jgi:two-component system sensor histidine kinase DesK
LLGHSLSLIALKAELAGKLAGRDLDACKREIADIEASARRALAEVRTAVTGYRDSGLSGALASARASLAAAGVELTSRSSSLRLAPAVEHVLALALREAVTNVVRHAGATPLHGVAGAGRRQPCCACWTTATACAAGDEVRVGNGLTGMRERAAALGGSCRSAWTPACAWSCACRRSGRGGSMIRIRM